MVVKQVPAGIGPTLFGIANPPAVRAPSRSDGIRIVALLSLPCSLMTWEAKSVERTRGLSDEIKKRSSEIRAERTGSTFRALASGFRRPSRSQSESNEGCLSTNSRNCLTAVLLRLSGND